MTRTQVLTEFAYFKRLTYAIDHMTESIGCIGKPHGCELYHRDYVFSIITASQPNLIHNFLTELEDAIGDRSSYRLRNKIKFETHDEWVEDNFNYCREHLAHWINPNEEDEKYPKHLTDKQVQEMKVILADGTGQSKMAAYRYIKHHLSHLSLKEVRDEFEKYVTIKKD